MKKPFTCSYCEEGIYYISPSTNKSYCKEHLESEYFGTTNKDAQEVTEE